jgi:hypothetical protein
MACHLAWPIKKNYSFIVAHCISNNRKLISGFAENKFRCRAVLLLLSGPLVVFGVGHVLATICCYRAGCCSGGHGRGLGRCPFEADPSVSRRVAAGVSCCVIVRFAAG